MAEDTNKPKLIPRPSSPLLDRPNAPSLGGTSLMAKPNPLLEEEEDSVTVPSPSSVPVLPRPEAPKPLVQNPTQPVRPGAKSGSTIDMDLIDKIAPPYDPSLEELESDTKLGPVSHLGDTKVDPRDRYELEPSTKEKFLTSERAKEEAARLKDGPYYLNVTDAPLDAVKDNKDFGSDLDTFIKWMYNKDPSKMSLDEKFDKYTTHMRWQETNEARAIKDLWYVRDNASTTDKDRASFGRLMMAWDNSSTVLEDYGTFGKTADYLKSVASSPSTIASFFGGGVTKLGKAMLGKSVTAAIRNSTADAVASTAARLAAKSRIPETLITAGGVAAFEGGVTAGHLSGLQEVRERTVDEYGDYISSGGYWAAIAANAGFGGFIGGVTRNYSLGKQREGLELIEKHHNRIMAEKFAAQNAAKERLIGATPEEQEYFTERLNFIRQIEFGKSRDQLDPLDPDKVWGGRLLWDDLVTKGNSDFKAGFSPEVLKRITAAGIDMYRVMDVPPNKRVTESLAFAIAEGKITNEALEGILDKYRLSKEQFSYMLMADFSEAGRTLAVASGFKRGSSAELKIRHGAALLAERGVYTLDDEMLSKVERAIAKDLGEGPNFLANLLRELDGMRIGFMTSQPATTAANIVSSVARIGVDMSDRFFMNSLEGRNPFKGVLDVVKGMTVKKEAAEFMAFALSQSAPSTASRLFNSARGLDDATGNNGFMTKISRTLNVLNTMSDVTFKKGVFYASINRQLMDTGDTTLGKSWSEFLEKHHDISKLPPNIVLKAKEDALRFTYQTGYALDKSAFGAGANMVIKAHRKVPFFVSSVIPFPRYIANQIEFIHDYTPLVPMVTKALEGLQPATKTVAKAILPEKIGGKIDPGKAGHIFKSKTNTEMWSMQATGGLMFLAAYALRASQKGRTEPLEFKNDQGETINVERWGGPWNTHLVIADALWRNWNDKHPKHWSKSILDAVEISTGVGFTGYDSTVLGELIRSAERGEWTTNFSKAAADVLATFTYPTAILRDVWGQIDPNGSAPTPYTRFIDVNGEGEPTINILDMVELDSEFVNRSLRFVPDVPQLQYLQTFNGQNDIPLYNGIINEPVRQYHPFFKQITGLTTEAPLNELQKDIRVFNIPEWSLIYKNQNATLEYATREALSLGHGKKPPIAEAYAKLKEEFDLNSLPPDEAKERFTQWYKEYQRDIAGDVKDGLEYMRQTKPNTVAGYIRTLYTMNEGKLDYEKGFKWAIQSGDIQGDYESVEDYIADTDSIPEEIARRERVMFWSKRVKDSVLGVQ